MKITTPIGRQMKTKDKRNHDWFRADRIKIEVLEFVESTAMSTMVPSRPQNAAS
jgi:hypothetical protein